MTADCLVCRELHGDVPIPGGLLWEDEAVAAFHVPPLPEGDPRPFLGHLLVVTRRHVARLGDLSDAEGAAAGRAAARLAQALTEVGGADWVFAAVLGTAVPHFHLHVLPRYAGTPEDLPWHAVDEWEGAPHGGAEEIMDLVGRLRAAL